MLKQRTPLTMHKVKDADGKFVKKAVKVTVAEFEKMKQQVIAIQRELEKKKSLCCIQDLLVGFDEGDEEWG